MCYSFWTYWQHFRFFEENFVGLIECTMIRAFWKTSWRENSRTMKKCRKIERPATEETVATQQLFQEETRMWKAKKWNLPPFEDSKNLYLVWYYFSHNSPVDRGREVFKPSTVSARVLVLVQKSSEKTFFSFGLEFSWGDVKRIGCFFPFYC